VTDDLSDQINVDNIFQSEGIRHSEVVVTEYLISEPHTFWIKYFFYWPANMLKQQGDIAPSQSALTLWQFQISPDCSTSPKKR
jgi:hypothetical protein